MELLNGKAKKEKYPLLKLSRSGRKRPIWGQIISGWQKKGNRASSITLDRRGVRLDSDTKERLETLRRKQTMRCFKN